MNEKQIAGEKAAEFIQNDMLVGLGTGSTVYYSIRRIAELVREGVTYTLPAEPVHGFSTSENLGFQYLRITGIKDLVLHWYKS